MLRRIGLGIGGLLAALLIVTVTAYFYTMPELPADDSDSAQWLRPGPFAVGMSRIEFVDESRETAANNNARRLPTRTFPASIWYPENGAGNYPLVLHSHGFLSERTDLDYVAEQLASYGYVVAAADYPLTSEAARGGQNANDLINQPTDVSFLIDSMLKLSANDKPFNGNIDSSRIALMGYSLGGITTTLATYHPRLRDERIKAAISIAGPAAGLVSKFYETSDVPFMMIAGTLDALINFKTNAAIIPDRVRNSVLVEITGGTHLGFVSLAEPMLRFMNHPDGLACSDVLANLDENPYATSAALGDETDGIVIDADAPEICASIPSGKAVHPGRQQFITTIAVLSFLEYVLNENPARREKAYSQLSSSLALEFQEAGFSHWKKPSTP